MMFYTENHDVEPPEASIHNIDTGMTYTLEIAMFSGKAVPVVRMAAPCSAAPVPARLYEGDQAVAFWKMLLYRNPCKAGAVSPHVFLARLLEDNAPAERAEENECPF